MVYKNNLLILLILSMFTFFEKVDAKYEKLFFDHSIKNINNETIDLNQYKGKTILLVNVASKCGFTSQYNGLQELHEKYSQKGLAVLGLPCNQFGGQEPGDAEQIKNFCTENFGVSFIITEKITAKGSDLHPIYAWLTDKKQNGKISSTVKWNFQKYLINKEGKLIDYFNSSTSPISSKITNQLN